MRLSEDRVGAARTRRPWFGRRPGGVFLGTVLVGIAAVVGFQQLTSPDDEPSLAVADEPGVIHVHGLGINPADDSLYAATHSGLFRIDDDGEAQRIGEGYPDIMGFTVTGPNQFLASGHPDLRDEELRIEGRPPLLGLIETTDAGRNWQPRSLLGEADLHTIAALDDLLLAYDSTGGRVLTSRDGGRTWETRAEIELLDLAVDPRNPDRLVAILADGTISSSNNGGRSWAPDTNAPAMPVVVRWGDDTRWVGTQDGALYRADTAGTEWTEVRSFDGAIEAILDDATGKYVAVGDSGIWTSPDAGRTWEQLYKPDH